jgi:hypothetical protein
MPDRSSISESNIILKAWLIAGTADICCAMLYTYIRSGANPLNVLAYVGQYALGREMSAAMHNNFGLLCFTGLMVHYTIAFVWTLVFYYAWPKVKLLQLNFILSGIIYGTFVWAVMNFVVLPIRKMAFPIYVWKNVFINAGILMIAIGIPLSLVIGNYYRKTSSST